MPRSSQYSSPEINVPATLPESTRDYYRSIWGFDPVADCRTLGSGGFRYEECFPLPGDLPLQVEGITICARVDWKSKEIRNRIVLRRTDAEGRRRKASITCVHTIVYAGPASDALIFADNLDAIDTSPENPITVTEEMLDRTGRPVTLPPWEHFAALKSYVAAVADMGIITLLRLSFTTVATAPVDTADGIPFGFNAEMQEQVALALYAIAPRAMLSIYRDLTCEFLDTHPPAGLVDQWMDWSTIFISTSKPKRWGRLLRHLGAPTLVYWFRHTEIADKFQRRLFIKPELFERAREIAPDMPWDTLRLEWEARRVAERMDFVNKKINCLNNIPPGEVWARTPFCDYTHPCDILSPDSTTARRSRVQAYLREMTKTYTETDLSEPLTDRYLNWAQKVSSSLDDVLMAPFPANRVRPVPIHHYDYTLKHNAGHTPAEVVDSPEYGDHTRRRAVVLSYPLAPDQQMKLANHWDFATRLALIGNPGTTPAIIAKLAQDLQPCVRLAAAARVRRGSATCEPLFGEILDPGEMVWLLSSHPGVMFQFGVTAWGDGSDAYRDWFKTRLREIKTRDKRVYLPGELYAWAYSEGVFLEEDERGFHGTHLAYYGLTPYACGQLPCLLLGLFFLGDERFDL